jgi:hypothetical protein
MRRAPKSLSANFLESGRNLSTTDRQTYQQAGRARPGLSRGLRNRGCGGLVRCTQIQSCGRESLTKGLGVSTIDCDGRVKLGLTSIHGNGLDAIFVNSASNGLAVKDIWDSRL